MAKDLDSLYAPGGRGKRWFKLKSPDTIDCVIVAADRGSGRRRGWLSNYHLAVLDDDGYAEVGKTFKGLTDQRVRRDDGALARPGRRATMAIRCACGPRSWWRSRTTRSRRARPTGRGWPCASRASCAVRDDKDPTQATTLAELRALYERQFETKGLVLACYNARL